MTALTIPRHTRTGCLYQFTPDARAALLHGRYAERARLYARIASDPDESEDRRRWGRRMARHYATEARAHFAQWQGAK